MSNVNTKKLVNFRLSDSDLQKLDYIAKDLSNEIKIKFDRTMALEYCIRWEYDKKNKTNKVGDYISELSNS